MSSEMLKSVSPETALKVQFDNQIFQMQTRGGISRYFTELIRTFLSNPELGVVPILRIRFTTNHHLVEAFPQLKLVLVRNPILCFFLKIQASIFGRTPDVTANLEHRTFYGLGINRRKISSIASITTLHDMIPELIPTSRGVFSPHLFKLRDLIRSDGVIAISQATLMQYQTVVGESRGDVRVIPLGARLPDCKSDSPLGSMPKKYFLFVGQRSGHKNAHMVLEAFSTTSNKGWKLVFVGGGKFSKSERKLLKKLGLREKVSHLELTDNQMTTVLKEAAALVVPSKLEGFGLPLIEAALSECAVLASRIPVFQEVMGETATYFDPESPLELSNLMQSHIDGELLFENLKSAAYERAKRFNWYECASQTANYYREVLQRQQVDS